MKSMSHKNQKQKQPMRQLKINLYQQTIPIRISLNILIINFYDGSSAKYLCFNAISAE